MDNPSFVNLLKTSLKEEELPWVAAALRHDAVIWDCLQHPEFNSLFFDRQDSCSPSAWSPANLALTALQTAPRLAPAALRQDLQYPLESSLRRRAARAFESFVSQLTSRLQGLPPENALTFTDPVYRLTQASLIALALRERRRLLGSWDGLAAELRLAPSAVEFTPEQAHELQGAWATPLACLYGMVPDPLELLRSLIASSGANPVHPRPHSPSLGLLVHILLSNPSPAEKLVDAFKPLLANLSLESGSSLLSDLSRFRPDLSSLLAQDLLNLRCEGCSQPSHSQPVVPSQAAVQDYTELIDRMEVEAGAHALAGQTIPSLGRLNTAWEATYRLQAGLAARQAKIMESNGDSELSLPAWKQAVDLAPQNPAYAAGYLQALLASGKMEEAGAFAASRLTGNIAAHPLLSLAAARYYRQAGDLDRARTTAAQAADSFLEGTLELDPADLAGVPELLLDLQMPVEASRSAQAILVKIPESAALLSWLGKAQMELDRLEDACRSIELAAALNPASAAVHRQYAGCLEALEQWDGALLERSAVLRLSTGETQVDDLHALAKSALIAGDPSRAAEACQLALNLDAEDGYAHAMLGQSLVAMGDPLTAYEEFLKATQQDPSLAYAWLAMADLQKQSGRPEQAVETLRAAALASPEAPEIYLSLGEAYLEDWEGCGHASPTQALAMFQHAADLSARSPSTGADPVKIGLRLGETLAQLGHTEDACRVLENAYHQKKEMPGLNEIYARCLLVLGRHEAAIPVLRKIAAAQPEGIAPRLELARSLVAARGCPAERSNAEEAVQALDQVLAAEPDHAEAKALRAEALCSGGRYAESLQAYQSALESDLVADPEWASRLSLGLGRSALALEQPDIAIASLEEAAQADPRNPLIPRMLCEAYHSAGLDGNALQSARHALRLAPDDPDTLAWFAETVTALPGIPAYESQGSEGSSLQIEALNAFARALALAPARTDLLVRAGKAQLAAGEKESALESFRLVVDDENASVRDLHAAARHLLDLGDTDTAIACLERAIRACDGDCLQSAGPGSITETLVQAYRQARNPQAALGIIERALAANPASISLCQARAAVLADLGHLDEALSCIQEAMDLDRQGDGIPDLHFQAAKILRQSGDLVNALSHAENVLSTDRGSALLEARTLAADLSRAMLQSGKARVFTAPIPPPGVTAGLLDYLYLKAELDLEAGETGLAAESLAAAKAGDYAAADPRYPALNARVFLRQGNRAAALDAIKSAIASAGEDGESQVAILYTLSLAAVELSQWDPAVYLARRAVEKAPQEPHLQINLASCLVQRAEAQRLCGSLGVRAGSPGESAVSEHAQQLWDEAVERAASLFPSDNGSIAPVINRWKARGQAAFAPGAPAAQALSTLSLYPLTPEDVAAQISMLRLKTGDTRPVKASTGQVASASPSVLALQAARAYQRHPLVLTQLALTLAWTGDHPQEALNAARDVLKQLAGDPAEERGWVVPALGEHPVAPASALAARTAYEAGDLQTAAACIDGALTVQSNEPAWHALAGKIYADLRDYLRSLDHFEQAAQLEPENYIHFLHVARACLAVPDEDSELAERAFEAIEKAAGLVPETSDAYLSLAEGYRAAGKLEAASRACDHAADLAPDLPAPLVLRAEIDLQSGSPQEAHDRLLQAMRLQTTETADLHPILLLSRALDSMDRPAEALEALDKALEQSGEALPLRLERVRLVRRSQGLPASVEALKTLAEEYPQEPLVLASLAKAQADSGQLETAIANAQKALLAPKEGDPLLLIDLDVQADLHLLLGRLLRQGGQLDQALHHLNESISKNPRMLDPYLELGKVLQERRQVTQALQVYNRATSIAPRDPRPYFQAGLALKENKDYLEAENMLRRAASLAPNDLGIHRQLGAVVALNLVHNRRRSALDL